MQDRDRDIRVSTQGYGADLSDAGAAVEKEPAIHKPNPGRTVCCGTRYHQEAIGFPPLERPEPEWHLDTHREPLDGNFWLYLSWNQIWRNFEGSWSPGVLTSVPDPDGDSGGE